MDAQYSQKADVIVVGAGPTGLATALLLHRYGVRDVMIIDKQPIRTQIGHASGLQPRTQEIMETLALRDDLAVAGGAMVETAFWVSTDPKEGIKRSSVAPEVTNATPYPGVLIQHQGRTEELFNAELGKRGLNVMRPFEFLDFEYVEDDNLPLRVYIKDISQGEVKIYACKYLVAGDGASSTTQKISGIEASVHQSHDTWIVADTSIKTGFPDFRRRANIRTTEGSSMLIPSGRNTVRLYLLLTHDEDLQELDQSKLDGPKHSDHQKTNRTTLRDIFEKRLRPIYHPYHIEIKDIEWISKYVIAQRVIDSFFDGKNLLLAGDSCHSHSPKAGQGMNTGLQDAYNLAWKLALVLRNRAPPSVLETYNTERSHIAHQLIDFDTKFAGLFGDASKLDSSDFHDLWRKSQGFTSGLDQEYPNNPLVQGDVQSSISNQASSPLTPGKRLLPMKLTRHIDGSTVSSLHTMPANGQFYELIFAGDISSEPRKSEFQKLYQFLTSPQSVLSAYNGPLPEDTDGWDFEDIHTNSDTKPEDKRVLNLYVVHTADHLDVELRPDFDLWKYNFYEDKGGVEHERHGVDANGPMQVALIRPDGIVGMIHEGNDKLGGAVHEWFGQFMKKPA